MRKPVIAGNWKMYKNVNEAVGLVSEIKQAVMGIDNVGIVLCPPFVALVDAARMISESNIALGAQNCYWLSEGAFTGEVSVSMLKSAGCSYIVVGHSERRKYFGETNETVNRKVAAVIDSGLVPIMCVGETLEERESGKTLGVVRTQIVEGLKGFGEIYVEPLIIAYEPVWAIGTGKTATPDQAQEVHAVIRELFSEMYNETAAERKRILYGGSVKPENIEELMSEKDIDGGLIGGASLKAESFVDLIVKTSELYAKKKEG
ncbi:MAG: triose-phosphate isomerase [Candidatus Omnitrophota bacterium]